MIRRVLDVDSAEEWGPTYEPFFAALAPPELWPHLFDPEEFGSAEGRIRALARAMAPPRRWKYHWLRNECLAFLKANFTHLALYHACRITDPESYLHRGLLASDIAVLNREAERLFGPSEALNQAISGMRLSGYRAHNHGGVYFFFARSGAIYGGDHYLSHGSEYLGRLAGVLGKRELAILAARGRPTLVRCEVELRDIEARHLRYAGTLPLQHRLTVREWPTPPGLYAIPGGFKYPKPLPAAAFTIEYLDIRTDSQG